MLDILCGSKNAQRILTFLFVNGKCYGSQLHRLLKTPLTPLQKTLMRLEKGGIIASYFEGKTRLYQFNPAFPLLTELEPLLRKSYLLLSPEEKKKYSVFKRESGGQIITTVWERLKQIRHLTFHAQTRCKEGGWNGKGKGEVIITPEGDKVLIFQEKGTWRGEQGQEFDFSNVFRWTLDPKTKMIALEHLRHGWNRPIFLFHLVPSGNQSLESLDSHLCEGDTYFGRIYCDQHSLRLNWRVIGPKKNEEMDYYYS